MHVCMYVCMYVRMYVCSHVCLYVVLVLIHLHNLESQCSSGTDQPHYVAESIAILGQLLKP